MGHDEALLEVGRVRKPHGLRGELVVTFFSEYSSVMPLGNHPGARLFTRIPWRAHSAAMPRVNCANADFDAA